MGLGQATCPTMKRVFGAPVEDDGVYLFEYENGVFGFMATGGASGAVSAHIRLIGTKGIIEIGAGDVMLRVMAFGKGEWKTIDTQGDSLHGPDYIDRAIADVVQCLREDKPCMLSARNALNATEIIFACYDSAYENRRIELPHRDDGESGLEILFREQAPPSPFDDDDDYWNVYEDDDDL